MKDYTITLRLRLRDSSESGNVPPEKWKWHDLLDLHPTEQAWLSAMTVEDSAWITFSNLSVGERYREPREGDTVYQKVGEELAVVAGNAKDQPFGVSPDTEVVKVSQAEQATPNKPALGDVLRAVAGPAPADFEAARRRAFILGMMECESDVTTHFEGDLIEDYDKGRNIGRAALRLDDEPQDLPYAVTFALPGAKEQQVIARLKTKRDAEEYLATSAAIDPDDLAEGYYGIDGPEEQEEEQEKKPTRFRTKPRTQEHYDEIIARVIDEDNFKAASAAALTLRNASKLTPEGRTQLLDALVNILDRAVSVKKSEGRTVLPTMHGGRS